MCTWGSAAHPVVPEEQRTDRSGTDPDSEDPLYPVETSKQIYIYPSMIIPYGIVQYIPPISALLAPFTAAKGHS